MSTPYRPAGFCPKCGYPLDAAPCPECGAAFARPAARWRSRGQRLRRAAVWLVATVALVVAGRYGVAYGFYEWWPVEHVAQLADGRGWLADAAIGAWWHRFERCASRAAERAATIEDEVRRLGGHPWAGCYEGQDHVKLGLSPSAGFAYQRSNCDGYALAAQYGGVKQVDESTLQLLHAEVPAALVSAVQSYVRVPEELLIVRWEGDVCLVPKDRMREFCLQANTGRSYGGFRRVDSQSTTAACHSAPVVPPDYRELILPAPLSAEVIEVGDISSAPANSPHLVRWRATATLNVGKRNGVYTGMYFFSGEYPRLSAEAVTVAEGTTRAAVSWFSHVNHCRDLPLKRGSTLSTRDSEADRPFDPDWPGFE